MKHYLPPSQHVKMMCASALTAVLFFIFTVPAFAAISYPFEIQFLPPASSTETKPDLDITNAGPNAEKWPGNKGEFNAKLVLNSEDDIDKISVPTPLWEYERGYKESTLGAYFEAQTLNKKFTTSDELKQLIRDHMNDGKLKSSLWLQVVYIPRVAFYQQDLQDDGTLAVNPTPALVKEHLFGHELTGALPEGK
ncbi:hypothetical protein K6V98_04820 [Collinsella sp. AGMB00827]|uniref:Uncharacterized protein n=1 Tax=Collinsella ureilytica TaxID=2869515 RepID=A0ABS7MKV5_9ACTN|nr:hypothetical protein [Collinsella urealyticum]MBY4797678.1 hypothetical protein [Collinsella urealyticum]